MANLISAEGHRKELTGPSHLVGSEAPADILVLATMGIAPQHYRLTKFDEGWAIEPLGPAGSTLVNGLPITGPTPLRHGEQISAGQLVLAFEDHAPSPPPAISEAPKTTTPVSPSPNPVIAALTKPSNSPLSKRPQPKRSKLPALALLGIILLIAGGIAAWNLNLLQDYLPQADAPTNTEPVPNSEPATLTKLTNTESDQSSPVAAASPGTSTTSEQAHFDILSTYTPQDADVGLTFTPAKLLKTYDKWQAEFTYLPTLEDLFEGAQSMAGIDLSSMKRVSMAMTAPKQSADALSKPPENVVVSVTFDAPFKLEGILTVLRDRGTVAPVESDHEDGVFQWTSHEPTDPSVFLFKEGNTLVTSTIGHARVDGEAPVIAQLSERALTRTGALTLALNLPSDFDPEALPIPIDFTLPESALVSLEFAEGFTVFAKAGFPDPETASQINELLKQTIVNVGKSITEADGQSLNPMMAILLRARHAAEGKSVETELAFSEFEMRMILSSALPGLQKAANREHATRAKVTAQLSASLCAAALAAGSRDLVGTTNPKEALEKLVNGVAGGKAGPFADKSFQLPEMSESHMHATLKHLSWDDGLVYHEVLPE